MGPRSNRTSVLLRKMKGHQGHIHTEKKPHEDTGRRWPCASQGEGPHEKPNLANTLIFDFQSLELRKKKMSVVSATQPGVLWYSTPSRLRHSHAALCIVSTLRPKLELPEEKALFPPQWLSPKLRTSVNVSPKRYVLGFWLPPMTE